MATHLDAGLLYPHAHKPSGIDLAFWPCNSLSASQTHRLHAHEETGNAHTFARDLAVGRWYRAHGVGWHEVPQFGVVRRLQNRSTWQPRWEALMAAPMVTLPPLRFFDPPAWCEVGLWLAREFLDYEPGIHWSQLQMQSGTTGINTTPVYNPVKQAQNHDPRGHFVRRWLPAMRRVPDTWLFKPWRMPESVQATCGVRVGHDIPLPVVDLATATRRTADRHEAPATQHRARITDNAPNSEPGYATTASQLTLDF